MYVAKEELAPTPSGIDFENDFLTYENKNKKATALGSTVKYMLLGVACICLFFGLTRSGLLNERLALPMGYKTGMFATITTATTTAAVMAVEASSPTYGATKATAMLPWDAVMEPYKPQTLTLTSLTVAGVPASVADYTVSWSLGSGSSSAVAATGSPATVQVDAVGVLDCTVTATHRTSGAAYTQAFSLAVKYVRREVRSLTDVDREAFFDALYKIYTVDAASGKKLYGAKFQTAEYFLWKHLTGAGTADCDHWHDGAGLVNNHVALTLEVEQALQAVDRTVAMPYWEYGMDGYLYKDWMSSPVFNADWFGEANPRNALHAIDDGGRWSNLAMPDGAPYQAWDQAKTGTINPYVNAYGHMRSPWNNNPSQLLGRHNLTYHRSIFTIPDCTTLQECFKTSNMADINFCLNGATHGPVHINIGGAWAEGTVFDNGDLDIIRNPNRLLYFKVLWRMGYTRCPASCEVDPLLTAEENKAQCMCKVPDEYIEKYGAKAILEDSDLLAKVRGAAACPSRPLLPLLNSLSLYCVFSALFQRWRRSSST
jgi:hypothetical protein